MSGITYTFEEVILQLKELPGKIKLLSEQIVNLTFVLEQQRQRLKEREDINRDSVLSLKGEDGKLKYTNEQSRGIALRELLRSDTEYNSQLDKVRICEQKLKHNQVGLEYHQNLFRAYQGVAMLVAGGK